jgi:hypothetical protein
MWKIELDGEAKEILDLKQLAPCCDCVLASAPDAQYCLSGAAFDQMTTAGQVETEAEHLLTLLNGLARLEHVEHRPVRIGARIYGPQGLWPHYATRNSKDARPPRSRVWEFAPPGFHSSDTPITKDGQYQRRKWIASDPALAELLAAIADEITWQRLRVAFEKICTLVSKSTAKGRWDNVMVKHGYASQNELDRFKENVQDPRHSGLDAVHGVQDNYPLKSTRMTEREGFEFVLHLLNTYVDKHINP